MLYWRISQSKGDRNLIFELADLASTKAARNVVFSGGTGTGKMHLATALAYRASRATAIMCASSPRSIR
ncbi:ATP-binding protein [Ralstonia solanacearum]|uniref:ATP-binding protein n=1 Tax=Ralstonia solanacearum TaxID=305 RepID=UPI0023E17E09|nr:ATP-binding protein [Ralstonia solanacearum]